MTNFIVRRLLQSIVLLYFISMLIYVIINLVPGGPFDLLALSNPRITQSQIDRLNTLLDLDKPILPGKYCPTVNGEEQPCVFDQGRYLRWLGKVLKGIGGDSWTMRTGTPVIEMIGNRLGYTLLLMGLSLVLALIIAIPLGVYSAVKQYSLPDYFVTAIAFFGQSMPTFWTGLMAIAIFSVALDWFPTSGVRTAGMQGDIIEALANVLTLGRLHPELQGQQIALILDGLHHVALPVLVLVFFNLAAWSRFTRSAMLEVMRQDCTHYAIKATQR
jgi:peptide/nickel transport system permease protein